MRYALRLLGIVAICAGATPANAQDASSSASAAPSTTFTFVDASTAAISPQIIGQPAGAPPTPEHTGVKATLQGLLEDFKNLPSMQNLFWLGVGSGAALAVHPFDNKLNEHLKGSSTAHNIFVPGAILGQSYTLVPVAAAVFAVGRFREEPKVSHVGMDLLRSLAVAEAMTQALKFTARRERPDGSGKNSFPSGHAADTFAFATALERHLGWKGAVPAYAFATYVATSRLHDNVHYVSDVAFGAAVGIIAGRTVTRHGRAFPVTVMSVPGGAAIVYMRNGPE